MSVRAKRWNENVKLLATTFNVIGLGTFGVGVVSPVFGTDSGLTSFAERLYSVQWQAAASAVAFHIMAQMVLRLIAEEN